MKSGIPGLDWERGEGGEKKGRDRMCEQGLGNNIRFPGAHSAQILVASRAKTTLPWLKWFKRQ